jgi:hypothetical protein
MARLENRVHPPFGITDRPVRTGSAVAAHAYIIEATHGAAGIAVSEPDGFRFYASTPPFYRLEKKIFPSLAALRTAVRALAASAAEPAHAGGTPSRRIPSQHPSRQRRVS